ncbi:hypothetical protein AB1Y20_005770 [Prymnesium parvum]|uniref:Uncharacterized protein n=1 Tax=Prymnesium parvum TaxID=97485 RepID=A0AB34J0P8_PRYPA
MTHCAPYPPPPHPTTHPPLPSHLAPPLPLHTLPLAPHPPPPPSLPPLPSTRPPPAPPPVSHASLNDDCLRAAAHLVSRGEYASLAAVSRAVCLRHAVLSLDQLPPPHAPLPALVHLDQLERRVAAHAAAFVATHGIATLADFEEEVDGALAALCVAPLPTPPPPAQHAEEIDIDDDASAASERGAGRFERFHVGPLRQHPAVRARWRPEEPFAPRGYAEVARHLLHFLAAQPPRRREVDVCLPQFEAYLQREEGASVRQMGVILNPHALPAAVHALRHATHKLAELEVLAVRRALERAHAEEERLMPQGSRRQGKKRRRRRQEDVAEEAVEGEAAEEGEEEEGEAAEEREEAAAEQGGEAETVATLEGAEWMQEEAGSITDAEETEARHESEQGMPLKEEAAGRGAEDEASEEPSGGEVAEADANASGAPNSKLRPTREEADGGGAAASSKLTCRTRLHAAARDSTKAAALPHRLPSSSEATHSLHFSVGSSVLPWSGALPAGPLDPSDRVAVGRWGEALV